MHLVKKNNIMVRCQTLQKASVNVMGGESASSNNPDKGRAEKRKLNTQTVQEKRWLVIKNV